MANAGIERLTVGLDRIRALQIIHHRCGDVLSQADIDALIELLPLDQVLEVLDLMAERLDRIEATYMANADRPAGIAPARRRA